MVPFASTVCALFSLLAGLTYQHNLQIGVVWLFFSGQQLFSDDLCIIFYRFFFPNFRLVIKIGAALYKDSSGCLSGISDHSTNIYHMVLVYVMLSCYQDSESFTTSVWPMHVASTQFYCVHFWPLHYIRIYHSIIAALRLMNNIWFKGRGVQSRRMFTSKV